MSPPHPPTPASGANSRQLARAELHSLGPWLPTSRLRPTPPQGSLQPAARLSSSEAKFHFTQFRWASEFRRPILGRLVVKGVARFSLAAIGEWFRRKAVVQLTPTVKTD